MEMPAIHGLHYYIRQKDYSRYCGKQMGMDVDDKLLCVDHEHDTGLIRGLICSKCNIGIGLLGDSLIGILKAAQYLSKGKE